MLDSERLNQLAQAFSVEFQTSTELQSHVLDHQRRSQRAKELLNLEHIPVLSEDELRSLFLDTDAYDFWRNKDRYFNKRLEKTGLQGYRTALLKLVSHAEKGLTPEDLAEALSVHGLGPLLVSELLAYRFPDTYYTFSESWMLDTFRALGADVKASAERGRQSIPYLYFAVGPLINQTHQALQEVMEIPVDNLVADIFLWWLKDSGLVAESDVQQLARVLREARRNAQSRKITGDFLRQIETALSAEIGEIETDVGLRARSDDRSKGYQYLDRAYFYLPGNPSRAGSERLRLWALLLPGKLWWGFAHWGSMEQAKRVQQAFHSLGLVQEDEQPVIAKGAVGSPPSWQGGVHFSLGEEMTAEEVSEQPDLDTLAEQIANNLGEMYQRISPQVGNLREAIDASTKNTWLLQAVPAQYDLEKALKQYRYDDWRFSRYQQEVQIGDRLIFWKAGERRGIYGLGNVVSDLHQRPNGEMAVDVEYTGRLQEPLLYETLQDHPLLSQMYVMRQTQGSNFRTSTEEWLALEPLLGEIIPTNPDGLDMRPASLKDRPMLALIAESLAGAGLHFTPWQIATFFTALQTKGFVILSGISGTGKTKLAQHFAELLPQPTKVALVGALSQPFDESNPRLKNEFANDWSYPIRADVIRDLQTPLRLYLYHDGEIQYVYNVADYRTQAGDVGIISPWPEITAPQDREHTHEVGKPNKKFNTWFRVSGFEKLHHPLKLSDLNILYDYQGVPSALINAFIPIEDPNKSSNNTLFISVRPDWRDGKSLLGYYNPLTGSYVWTDFLRFLLRARQDYTQNRTTASAWFVILDEMNLARVEYYFSDLLSVLESGRDEAGWTREPLRLEYPDSAKGDLPESEIHLPPNLYIIGTVNVDETTHAFSPKVLDRAFTLELTEADFGQYNLEVLNLSDELSIEERQALLQVFSNQRRFAVIDKSVIASYLQSHPEVRQQLQRLNYLLRPYDLHFGYRVFDEIIAFLDAAESSQVFAEFDDQESSFDAAVLMKVLPKFHGSRGKLEEPLKRLLAWCLDPEAPQHEIIQDTVNESNADQVRTALGDLPYQFKHTAERAVRMLWALHTSGFAAFG